MKKAGVEETWKAFIPVYNLFVMYKTVGLSGFFSAFRAVYIVAEIILLISNMSFMGKLDKMESDAKKASKSIVSAVKYSDDVIEETTAFAGRTIIWSVFGWIGSIGSFVVGIFFAIKMRNAYGLPGGFIAGLIIVPIIFYFIIGFGKYEFKSDDAEPVQNA